MRKIIASLDIGSDTIKLIVGEIQKNKVNVLSCADVVSQGIKKGYIVNPESAELALKKVFKKTEDFLGLPIKKVLVSIPSYSVECFPTSGSINIKSDDKVVTHNDLIKAMHASVYKNIETNRDLVSILPTKFIINDEEQVSSPINMIASKLTVNAVAVTVPRKNNEILIKCLDKMGIKVVDICIEPLADYYHFKNSDMSKKVGAIVNVGQSNTTVSIFNKGILTTCEVIDIGASAIDNDIAYVYKISKKDAKELKEKLVVSDIHLAQPSESLMVKDISGNDIKINQYDVSAVAISRLNELFNLVKKQINLLTKKEISYIIVSGGTSEINHFNQFIQTILGDKAIVANVDEIGARSNRYSVALGMIKYYNSRLKLRNVEFSALSLDEQEELGGTHHRVNISDNSLLGKIYGYFFDN